MSGYLDYQHRRWMRPDAARWLLPNQRFWRSSPRVDRKYSPDQPRVPAGYREGGRWTGEDSHWTPVSSGGGISIALPTINVGPESDELPDFANDLLGGLGQALGELRDALARIRLAGDIPTGDSPPEIPEERPPTSWERTALLKAVARSVAAGIMLDSLVVQLPWLATQEALVGAYNDSPKSLEELQSAVGVWRAGTDRHHVVEQTSAEEDGFPRSLIDSPGNLVRIPRLKHQEITAWYNANNPDFGGQSPRDYLRGRSWDVRYAIGLEALKDFGVLKP